MKIDLTKAELDFIFKYVVYPLNQLNAKVFLFGSRATNQAQKYSDVDLLIVPLKKTEEIQNKIGEISERVEESNFPYKVDLVLEQDLADDYRENINQTKVLLK